MHGANVSLKFDDIGLDLFLIGLLKFEGTYHISI